MHVTSNPCTPVKQEHTAHFTGADVKVALLRYLLNIDYVRGAPIPSGLCDHSSELCLPTHSEDTATLTWKEN